MIVESAALISRQSENSARDLVERVLKQYGSAPRDKQFANFREMLAAEPEYQRSVDWYFFVNISTYMSGQRHPQTRPSPPESDRRLMAAAKEDIKSQIQLLSLTMPNGKPMRECSGQEMATFGAAYKRIADRVGKAKTVGAVLSEDDVRGLMTGK